AALSRRGLDALALGREEVLPRADERRAALEGPEHGLEERGRRDGGARQSVDDRARVLDRGHEARIVERDALSAGVAAPAERRRVDRPEASLARANDGAQAKFFAARMGREPRRKLPSDAACAEKNDSFMNVRVHWRDSSGADGGTVTTLPCQ